VVGARHRVSWLGYDRGGIEGLTLAIKLIIVVVVVPCRSASTVSIRGRWLSFVGCGGAMVVMCERSWAMAAVFTVVSHRWWGRGHHV